MRNMILLNEDRWGYNSRVYMLFHSKMGKLRAAGIMHNRVKERNDLLLLVRLVARQVC